MPYTNPKHKTRHQRRRRRAGFVRRIELTLSSDNARDHEIADYLDELPRGAGAEFIRQAIIEKIDRETARESDAQPQIEQQPVSASDEFNALFAELDHQRREASQQMETMIATIAAQSEQIAALRAELARQPATISGATPEAVEVVSRGVDMTQSQPGISRARPAATAAKPVEFEQSSGIDMSRPRPRPTTRRTPVSLPATEPDEVTEADLIALGKLMSRSIKNAQPGRGSQHQR